MSDGSMARRRRFLLARATSRSSFLITDTSRKIHPGEVECKTRQSFKGIHRLLGQNELFDHVSMARLGNWQPFPFCAPTGVHVMRFRERTLAHTNCPPSPKKSTRD